MDLSSMLNNGPAPQNESSQSMSPVAQRQRSAHGTNGQHTAYGSVSHPLPPGATSSAPPSSHDHHRASGSLSSQGRGLTPLQTPNQTPPAGQYPFPQHSSPGLVGPSPGQQNSPYSAYAALGPGGRPPSLGYLQYSSTGVAQSLQTRPATTSLSPPSRHSQTPQSVHHQSPLSAISQGIVQPGAQHHRQTSQPNTPLGPPPLVYSRTATFGSHPDAQSPYQQRTPSNVSNGMPTGSPAQQLSTGARSLDSPTAYNRPPSHLRRTSDHLGNVDRDRSVSVSPKTKVPMRTLSQDSRENSVQEGSGARGSMRAPAASHADTQGHVMHPSLPNLAQPHVPNPGGEVSQLPPLSSQVVDSGPHVSTPLSETPAQIQVQKMGMSHLLTPVHGLPPSFGLHGDSTSSRRESWVDEMIKPSPADAMAPVRQQSSVEQETGKSADWQVGADQSRQTAEQQQHGKANGRIDPMSATHTSSGSRKRVADGEPDSVPPPKRERMRRHLETPIWAQLSPRNPRYSGHGHSRQNGGPPNAQQNKVQRAPQIQNKASAAPVDGGASVNGNPPVQSIAINYDHPWLNPVPFDLDLIRARNLLGPWEKSCKWNTPYPDLLRAVQDWLFNMLLQHKDIGQDPSTGAIEIEAKIGTLLSQKTSEKAKLPVRNMTVLDPSVNRDYRFESEMDQTQHQAMNAFLNKTIQGSMQPGRCPMAYEHIHETDSFGSLTPAGFAALPPTVHKHPLPGRELKLRTTIDKTGKVKARIVKVPLGDLHIFNPSQGYDCRISMNLEVNLERPGLDFGELVEAPTAEKPAPPSRVKDRLSYKHLAYEIDLTRVEVRGLAPKYELELEVDALVLRRQMALMMEGKEHAFGDVVSGFLDNATFLMRQQTVG